MNTNHLFLVDCFLQQTNHFEALELLANDPQKLKIGEELQLVHEENKVYAEKDKKIIGLLSDEYAKPIINYLKMNWKENLFECRISKLIVSAKRYHHSGVSGTIVSLKAVPL